MFGFKLVRRVVVDLKQVTRHSNSVACLVVQWLELGIGLLSSRLSCKPPSDGGTVQKIVGRISKPQVVKIIPGSPATACSDYQIVLLAHKTQFNKNNFVN